VSEGIDHQEVIVLYTDGRSLAVIAAKFSVGRSRIRAILVEHGITIRSAKPRATPPATPGMIDAYARGHSAQAIADAINDGNAAKVLRMLRAAGVPIRPKSLKVADGGKPRGAARRPPATPAMVEAYNNGVSIQDIATTAGLSKSQARTALLNAGVTLRPVRYKRP
jgi:hypothetical protein